MTPIQALIYTLFDIENWFVWYYPYSGPVQCLFFTDPLFERILKISWDVIFLDYISYYCIPLFIIIGVTGLNASFYIGFAFVFSKIYADYPWVLFCLQQFYVKGDIPNPIFARTDCEKALVWVLEIIFL